MSLTRKILSLILGVFLITEQCSYAVIERQTLAPSSALLSEENSYSELRRVTMEALKRYSNVHRGSGQHSVISTKLYEHARELILDYLGLDKTYTVAFLNAREMQIYEQQIKEKNPEAKTFALNSTQFGLPIGACALVVKTVDLPIGAPKVPGGGTIKFVSPDVVRETQGFGDTIRYCLEKFISYLLPRVVWADYPDRFEAGTPNIIGSIVFAKALEMIKASHNEGLFQVKTKESLEALWKDDFGSVSGEELFKMFRETLVGKGEQVPTEGGNVSYINFDHGASTPTFRAIADVYTRMLNQPKEISEIVLAKVKGIAKTYFGYGDSHECIFSSNTTDAVNIVAENMAFYAKSHPEEEPVIINTLLEHNSNELPWRQIPGVEHKFLMADRNGVVDIEAMEKMLKEYNWDKKYGPKKRIKMIALSGASNVLGTMNDIQEISRIAHRYGAEILVDAAQTAVHREIKMKEWGIDYLAFSAHKMYAPFGSGGLIVRKNLLSFPQDQLEQIIAQGEENLAGIAALGKSMEILHKIGVGRIEKYEEQLTQKLLFELQKLRDEIPGLEILGITDPNSPWFDEGAPVKKGPVVAFSIPKIPHNMVAKFLAEWGGIGVRDGCFCANILVKWLLDVLPFENIMATTGLKYFPSLMKPFLLGVARASFGLENTPEEIDRFIEILKKIAGSRFEYFPPIQTGNYLNRILNPLRAFLDWAAVHFNAFLASRHYGTPVKPKTATEKDLDIFTDGYVDSVYGGQEAGSLKKFMDWLITITDPQVNELFLKMAYSTRMEPVQDLDIKNPESTMTAIADYLSKNLNAIPEGQLKILFIQAHDLYSLEARRAGNLTSQEEKYWEMIRFIEDRLFPKIDYDSIAVAA